MKKENENITAPTLGCMMGRAYQIMLSQLAAALKDEGLDITTSEYLVIRAVYSSPGLQQCEIADLVGKDKAAVCRCVATMEKKGLVATESVSHKCLKVYPTELALEIKPRVMSVADKRHRALTSITTPAELEIFADIIQRIIINK